MRHDRRSIAIVAVIFAAFFYAVGSAAALLSVVASNWKFTPSTITLKAGVAQVLHFTSSEGVHGVQSDALGIPLTTIAPGSGVNVTVTPKTAGTFIVPCAIVCGAGHADMKLTVKVVQ